MTNIPEYTYHIAGLNLSLRMNEKHDIRKLLPTFVPFLTASGGNSLPDLCLSVEDKQAVSCPDKERVLLSESMNDVGHVFLYRRTDTYIIELHTSAESPVHVFQTDPLFKTGHLAVDFGDPLAGQAITSFIRIAFSQRILLCQGMLLHASAVELNGKAFLFMGKSGTGKSTHSRLWKQCFPACTLLNDDNPAVRITGGKVIAYGTPWSGKTPCYKNEAYPVGGMVQLEQAKANRFTRLTGIEAFVAILPGCSVIAQSECLHNALCDTLTRLVEQIAVGKLQCLPDEEAARLCAGHLIKQE